MLRKRREYGENLLSLRQASAYLGISRKQLYRLVRDGDLPHVRSGRRLQFRIDDLDDLREAGPRSVFLRGFLAGVLVAGLLIWSRRRTRRRLAQSSGLPAALPAARRPTDTHRRRELLREFEGLLSAHYASTRLIAALFVLKNRRKVDRRLADVPVGVDRRSGRDRRGPSIDAQVEQLRSRALTH